MHNVGSSISSLATTAATYSTRTVTALGLPAFLALRLLPNSLLKVRRDIAVDIAFTGVVIAVSAPSILTCGVGAAEGTVRTVIKLFDYCIHRNADKDTATRKWDQFVKEGTTMHGLIRGTLSPLSGYTIIDEQWNLKEADSRNGIPRVLKTEYYVYRAPLAIGRGAIEAAKLAVRFFKWAGEQIVWGAEKLWEGACYVGRKAEAAAKAVWNFIRPALEALWDGVCFVGRKIQDFAIAAWNTIVPAVEWLFLKAIDGIVAAWDFSKPLRTAIRYVVWDLFLVEFVGKFVFKKLLYEIFYKTVIVEFFVKTLLNYIVWKPVKIAWNWAIRPGLISLKNAVVWLLTKAYDLSVWATQLASRLINR